MARYENEWDRDRDREREQDRDRDRSYDRDREQGRHEGQRRHLDLGQRSNEYGSHAGWGGQGFSQGSFGHYGGQGDRLYTQSGGQGFGAQQTYEGRNYGGGMGTYQGSGQGESRGNREYNQGRGSERGNEGNYGQNSENYNAQRYSDPDRYRRDFPNRDRDREDFGGQHVSGREGGWGGYGTYDRERRDADRYRNESSESYRENRGTGAGQHNWSGSQGWVGGQQGWSGGSTMGQSGDWSGRRGGQHYGRGPKGWQRSDDRIRDDISERLADHPDVDASEIEVTVVNGEVTLKGSVDERQAKRIAEDVAENVSGVRDVQNQIRVNRGFWGAIKDTFTGNSGEDNQRDRSGQPQTTTGDIVSTTPSIGTPAHSITPAPSQQQTPATQSSSTTRKEETVGTRK